ncbi:MAG: riboflavin synthase [Planctomycetota bacterium]|jgi:riboflavin synthase|nr:riboflavin synthase [Planctomycetota bacterium]MDP6762178.1 riboflavin synthase [Planctomycetota bacterium]MDP6990066.1 riboflavin synthase [Planctomycetota bacterium]
MFTGIVEGVGVVSSVSRAGEGLVCRIAPPAGAWSVAEGDSVAVCGACLTVAGLEAGAGASEGAEEMVFDLSAETLARTWFDALEPGGGVNLERALRLGDRLDGHLVSGHIDGLARVAAIADSGDGGRRFTFEVDPGLERYLIEKGSVTLDGISLTVVEPRGPRFDVAVIPLTLERTHLGRAAVDQRVNIEADLVGKWIERLLPPG